MAYAPFTVRLADVSIAIAAHYDYTRQLCWDYRTDSPPELMVEATPQDLTFERNMLHQVNALEQSVAAQAPEWYLESLALYRKIARALLPYQVLLIHGSCIAMDKRGYLFTAKSGTGKSTHARLWRERFGSRTFMVNDDKPLLRLTPQGVLVYGTPWDGKHRLNTNTSVPLKALCILERGEENQITPIRAGEAFPFILNQIYRPNTSEDMKKALMLLNGILESTDLYRLRCNMDPSAVEVSYWGMQGKELV